MKNILKKKNVKKSNSSHNGSFEKNSVGCNAKLFYFVLFFFFVHMTLIFTGVLRGSNLLSNLFTIFFSFIAFLSLFFLYRKVPSNFPRERVGNILLLTSVFLFFLGDFFWAVEEIFLGNLVPLGGVADILWNLAYFSLIASVGFFISFSFVSSYPKIIFLLVLGLIFGGVFLYWDISEDIEEGTFNLPHFIQDLYPVYDIILIVMISILIWPIIGYGNKFFIPWFLFGLGVISRIIFDLVFVSISENGIYYTGHPMDIFYVAFYVFLVSYASFKCRGELKSYNQ